MLKMAAGFVLGLQGSSTYPGEYASGPCIAYGLADSHFEHPHVTANSSEG